MRTDAVVGAVGGIVLVIALGAVLLHESGTAPEASLTFPVSWRVEEGGSTARDGELDEGEVGEFEFELASPNVTRVRVTLSWQDENGDPDRFNLTVRGPSGASFGTATSDSGTAALNFDVQVPPGVQEVRAGSPGEAAARLAQRETSTRGLGTWTMVVELVSAPGVRPVPGVPDLVVQPDGTNDFTVAFSHDVYRPQLGAPVPPS